MMKADTQKNTGADNADFYVQPSYFKKKCIKIKRKAKARAFAFAASFFGDYSPVTLDYKWQERSDRWKLINELIQKYGYENYLEIGCSTDACFKNIAAPNKIGVDPFSGGTHRMTSDEFFKNNNQKFDIIFIDGLHQYAQVKKDIENSIAALSDNGIIILHDCLPLNFYAQLPFPSGGDWNGDTWKAFVEARTWSHVDSALCLIDHGLGIIKKRPNSKTLALGTQDFLRLKYKDLAANYKEWLNTIEYNETLGF